MRSYWRTNLWIISILLLIWFFVSFGAGILFVDELNGVRFFGFKLGFWFAQQGSILGFLVLLLAYVVIMNRVDRSFGADEDD